MPRFMPNLPNGDTKFEPSGYALVALAEPLNGGQDLYWGSMDDDYMTAAVNEDTSLRGYMGNDTLVGFNGDDRLNGCIGNDLITGGNGNDLLVGCFGNDVLQGGPGSDTLFGDRYVPIGSRAPVGPPPGTIILEQDVLAGGPGSDTFVLATQSQNMLDLQLWDTITDLNLNTDQIAVGFAVNSVAERVTAESGAFQQAVDALFADGGLLETPGTAVILRHDGQDWLVVSGSSSTGRFGSDDVLANITGYEGSLGVTDFVLAQYENYVIGF